MKIHRVYCDKCKRSADLKWNGEHWLCPKDWTELFDEAEIGPLNIHLCQYCTVTPMSPPKHSEAESHLKDLSEVL